MAYIGHALFGIIVNNDSLVEFLRSVDRDELPDEFYDEEAELLPRYSFLDDMDLTDSTQLKEAIINLYGDELQQYAEWVKHPNSHFVYIADDDRSMGEPLEGGEVLLGIGVLAFPKVQNVSETMADEGDWFFWGHYC